MKKKSVFLVSVLIFSIFIFVFAVNAQPTGDCTTDSLMLPFMQTPEGCVAISGCLWDGLQCTGTWMPACTSIINSTYCGMPYTPCVWEANSSLCTMPAAVCGNGVCEVGEDQYNCPQDCSYAQTISNCTFINTPGTYQLVNDIYVAAVTNPCIILSGNAITLNCNNHSIIGQGQNSNSAIEAQYGSNIIIKNCNVSNFKWGITTYNINYSTITNNRAANNIYDGIQGHYVNHVNITNNYFSNNNESGIDIQSGTNNYIFNNTIINSKMSGIDIFPGANYNTITYNYLAGQGTGQSKCGVNIHSGADYNTVMYNTYVNAELCDSSITTVVCLTGSTQPCGSDVGVCQSGIKTCDANGRWGFCTNSIGPSLETCNGLDDNCNGITDDIYELTYSKTVTLYDVLTSANPTTAGNELETGTNAYLYYANPGIYVVTDGPVLGVLGLTVPGIALDFANKSCLTVQDNDFGYSGLPVGAASISRGDTICIRNRNLSKMWQINITNTYASSTTYDVYSVSKVNCAPVPVDSDNDSVPDENDQCPQTPGFIEYHGCPYADQILLELHTINHSKEDKKEKEDKKDRKDENKKNKEKDCEEEKSCKQPIAGAEVKIFNRNNHNFRSFYGTKNPKKKIYDMVFENNIGKISSCITNINGKCFAGENTTGDYLVIIKYIDEETNNIIYTGKPKSPEDFINGVAFKYFKIIKIIKENGNIEFKGDEAVIKQNQSDTKHEDSENFEATGRAINPNISLAETVAITSVSTVAIVAIISIVIITLAVLRKKKK